MMHKKLSAYEDTGITPERVAELAQAERDGRLVVLPCAVGSIVYKLKYSGITRTRRKTSGFLTLRDFRWAKNRNYNICAVEAKCTKSDMQYIGKTVFLTREEAEAALQEETE